MALTDDELVKLALDGDSAAFGYLFMRYRTALHQFCLDRNGNDTENADDLLQDTFIKVFLNLPKYDSRFSFSQWVYTITLNTFRDQCRKRKHYVSEQEYPLIPDDALTPEETVISRQQYDRLKSCMSRLDPKYRDIIELRFFNELSYAEISEKLGKPIGTVKTQIHRAKELLNQIISVNTEP